MARPVCSLAFSIDSSRALPAFSIGPLPSSDLEQEPRASAENPTNAERLPELARELVGLKLDMIVAGLRCGDCGRQTRDSDDPDRHGDKQRPGRHGLVASLARPGGNVTGLSLT